MKTVVLRLVVCCLAVAVMAGFALGESAPFDLAGPKVDVRVDRAGKTLPISAVPNLLPGDRLWIHPDLPNTQSAHYLLVVAFLRGATNPPPENWFTRAETWNKKIRDEGIFVVVPQEAEQVLVFLAPETGGDFSTLRSAVRARPGAFVRASQDLGVASLDRMRLETYLAAVRKTAATEPEELENRSKLLARSLNIKVDPTCFDKPANEQATCLTSHTDQMVLADGHSQSMVSTVTSGASADLMTQLSYSASIGGGTFSPYVGAIIDIARILDNLHTAEYQYIPALSLPRADTLNLKLNNPPSFKNPKSVIVIGLPPIEQPQVPPLRAVNPKQAYCVEKPEVALMVEGAPLVFATEYAHDLAIHITGDNGKEIVLPVTANPNLGGLVLDAQTVRDSKLDREANGYLRGMWGFQPFDGPHFHLASARPEQWRVASPDANALIIGRTDTLHLQAASSACVMNVRVKNERGDKIDAAWKMNTPDDLQVEPALQNSPPGKITIAVSQFGLDQPDDLDLQAYAEAARLDDFTIYTGDARGVLLGTRLDEVAGLELNGAHFKPENLSRTNHQDELTMMLNPPSKADLKPGQKVVAQVALKDGRTLPLPVTIATPRPQVTLIRKSILPASPAASGVVTLGTSAGITSSANQVPPTPAANVQIHLTGADELPLDATLTFALKAVTPDHFARNQTIDVATEDESLHATLSVSNGRLVLEDATTVVATLDPGKDLGVSAFGPLKFRPVEANGAAGDWQPLAQLVRLPGLSQLKCVKSPVKQCTLSGSKLFLIDAIASDAAFTNSVSVPEGYSDLTLLVPHPDATRTLYLKLRDNPAAVNTAQVTASADTAASAVAGPTTTMARPAPQTQSP